MFRSQRFESGNLLSWRNVLLGVSFRLMQQDDAKNLEICAGPVFHIIRHIDNEKFIQNFDRRTARKRPVCKLWVEGLVMKLIVEKLGLGVHWVQLTQY
jgi:hypothetical protein